MIARVLDMPDDDAALAAWLDDRIAGQNLHDFVAELAAVQAARPRRSATPAEVSAWLGDALPDVLERGMAALDRRLVGELLRSPHLLPGLQELAFIDGGRHWDAVVGRTAPPVGFSAADLLGRIAGDGSTLPLTVRRDPESAESAARRDRGPSLRPGPSSAAPRLRLPTVIAGLAASVLVALGAWSLLRPAAPWGWNRADAFAAAAPDVYLERLAAGAAEWSAAVPTTEPALATRLRAMLAGCERLLAAPHEPLAATDREWLRERCRAWREKFAGQIAALAQSHDVAAIRREADATVEKLTAALRARASEVKQRRESA